MNVERFFASDNSSGADPYILEALIRINQGHYHSYGHDDYTKEVKEKFKTLFNSEVDVYFTYNGTGANVLSLSALLRPFEGVLCSDIAHINTDECGALERYIGAKLLPITHENGKIKTEKILPYLQRLDDEHAIQPTVLSLTQPTEYGTLYTLEELAHIRNFARKHNLYIHIDGARLANAAVALEISFAELANISGADVISFGGTKNGLVFGEAAIFFPSVKHENVKFFHKQSMQLSSKTRYIAAQYDVYMEKKIWKKNAIQANAMANYLFEKVKNIKHVLITQPSQCNAIFAKIPKEVIEKIQKDCFFYVWNELTSEVRWMTSFDTTKNDIDSFVRILKQNLNAI